MEAFRVRCDFLLVSSKLGCGHKANELTLEIDAIFGLLISVASSCSLPRITEVPLYSRTRRTSSSSIHHGQRRRL